MFELFENSERFSWDSIGDVVEGRQHLGEEMPVFVYRLFQFTIKDVLVQRLGKETTVEIFREAGHVAGEEFASHLLDLKLPLDEFVAHLQSVLQESRVGILRLEKFDPETGAATLTVSEDLDCSGLPVSGETVCNYDEGFLAGVLNKYTNRDYVVIEVDCWATGSRVCRFEAHVRD